jgi:hypothetical protein
VADISRLGAATAGATARVEVFPFRVVYLVRGNDLVILAYAHARRRPGYWQHRNDD